MRVLITGGAGFIGSHLAERLIALDCDVVCLDNFNNFYDPEIKNRNIEKALASRKHTVLTGDILDCDFLDRVFEEAFDAVVHLAAYAGVRQSIALPELYTNVNVQGTLNVLEHCRRYKVPRFIFASSSVVYPGHSDVALTEDEVMLRPLSPYAATKVAGEALCHTYHHLFGISMHVLRLFTVYGPRQRPEMAIHVFAKKMLKNQPVKVFGDGRSSRDYTFIDDVTDGIARSVERCEGFKVINLGTSRPTHLDDLITILGKRLGVEPQLEFLSSQPGDMKDGLADITLARELLDYEPTVQLEEGIGAFCTWLETSNNNRG